MAHRGDPQDGRGDRARALAFVVDDEIRLPVASKGYEIRQHGRWGNVEEHQSGAGFPWPGAREARCRRQTAISFGNGRLFAQPCGSSRETSLFRARAEGLGGGKGDRMPRVTECPRQRDQRVEVPVTGEAREEHTH